MSNNPNITVDVPQIESQISGASASYTSFGAALQDLSEALKGG